MFYVVCGFRYSDREGDGPTLEIRPFDTPERVLAFHEKFRREYGSEPEYTFRVFEGRELHPESVTVTVWRLK